MTRKEIKCTRTKMLIVQIAADIEYFIFFKLSNSDNKSTTR